MSKTLLIDCNALGYAALFAMHDINLTNEDGIRTEIIYNFLLRILNIAKKFDTNKIVYAWDSERKYSKRKKRYKEYKENRRKDLPEPELKMIYIMKDQLELLRNRILLQMGFNNVYKYKGYEADDIIAYIARGYTNEFVIVSSDNDFYQCLTDKVSIYDPNPRKDSYFTKEMFIEKYGIHPKKWRMVKCLAGCHSDNVKGIEGVGEMTAIKYLKGDLPAHYKIYRKIENERHNIININYPLVSLPFPFFPGVPLIDDKLHKRKFRQVFEHYDFNSFLTHEKWTEWKAVFRL